MPSLSYARVEFFIFFEQAADADRAQVVGADILVAALVLAGSANRHPDSIDDNNVAHDILLLAAPRRCKRAAANR
jgi:hypothetical protein